MNKFFQPPSKISPALVGAVVFIILGLLMIVGAGGAAADGELVRALKNRETFLDSKEKTKTRANWLTLIKEFEAAALAQPDIRHASRARYVAADLSLTSAAKFKEKADYERADQLARRAVRECPRCTHAAPAQLVSGQALLGLGQLDQAHKQLMKVELSYPDSPEVAVARGLLAKLSGKSAPEKAKADPPKADPPKAESSKSDPPKTAAAKAKSAPSRAAKRPPPPKPRADGRPQVYHLTLSEDDGRTTVTAYLDKVAPYVYNLIPPAKPGGSFRVYADLKGAVLAPQARLTAPDKSALVRLAKMNQFKDDVVRVVLDLPEAHPYRPTFLDQPPRLVFQVTREAGNLSAPAAEAQPEDEEKIPPPRREASKPATVSGAARGPADSLARQLGLKVKRVVIDAGHGGKDGGAVGYGLKEKDIVLKLAKKLSARIERRLGLTVLLTRGEDKFITLERRTRISKEEKGDLFISLHVNANTLDSVEGFETYVLNFATDRTAMAVAARENASSDKSVAELQDILHLIAKNTKVAESRALAQSLHKAALTRLNKKHRVRDLGVKEAPFYVLVGTAVPSILVEIGFVTNEKEAGRLAEDAYLDLIAEGLCNGLENYVKGF